MRDAPLYPAIVAVVLAKIYPIFSLYDEIFCLVAVFVAFISLVVKKYHKKRYLVFASTFSLFVFASFPWLSEVSNLDFVLSLLFLSKFFIFFIYIENLGHRECQRLVGFILIFTIVGLLVQFFNPDLHAQLIPRSLERGYLQIVLTGFQTNPNYLAITICLFLVSYKRWLVTKGAFFLALLSTGSRSGLGFAMLMIGAKKSQHMSMKILLIYMLFALGLCAIWFYFIGIFDYILRDIGWLFDGIGSNLYIRGIVINISLLMAVDFFPIGGGLGSFATPYSWASPIYDIYKVSDLHFFYEQSSAVFDSNLATVLGSSGVLGTLFFLTSLRVLLMNGSIPSRTVTIFFVAIICLSIFLPVFSNGYLAIILSLIWRIIHE